MVVVHFESTKRRERRRFVALVICASLIAFAAVVAIGAGWGRISAVSQWTVDAARSVALELVASAFGDAEAVGGNVHADGAVSVSSDVLAASRQQSNGQRVHRSFPFCQGAKRVTCVVDGDTFWLDGEKIRIADIDTPEIGTPQCARELALGEKAKHRLQSLLNGGPFEMHSISDRDTDQYGRKLRILVRNGQSIGDKLVAEGLARTWEGQRRPWCI